MNSFCVKLFMVSILFSTSASASPVRLIRESLAKLKKLSGWERRAAFKSIERGEDGFLQYNFLDLSKSQRKQALDTLAAGKENELYSGFYSHLENKPNLINIIGGGGVEEATHRLVVLHFLDNERFMIWLELIWKEVDKNIFLELWDLKQMRKKMIALVRKEHLVDNPDLLLKCWWEGFKDRLTYLIHRSLIDIEDPSDLFLFFPSDLQDFLKNDPLGRTILRASGESNDFNAEIGSLLTFIRKGVRQPDSEEGQKLKEMLNNGQITDERFVIPAFTDPL